MSGAYIELAGAVVGDAVRAFVKTVAGMLVLAIVLSVSSFLIAFDGSWLRGGLAVLLALVNVAVIGSILSVKRAVLRGLARGIQQQHLGRAATQLVLSPDGPIGKAVERVPLAEAERRLRAAVEAMLGQRAQQRGFRAWIARGVQSRLVQLIEQVTLGRFRADAAEHGGSVDLAKACAELGDRADTLLYDKVRGMANRLTVLLVLASTAIAALVATGLRHLNI